jgi:hypothetical protein
VTLQAPTQRTRYRFDEPHTLDFSARRVKSDRWALLDGHACIELPVAIFHGNQNSGAHR